MRKAVVRISGGIMLLSLLACGVYSEYGPNFQGLGIHNPEVSLSHPWQGALLLTPQRIQYLRAHKAEYEPFLKHMKGHLQYQAHPVAVFAPDPHYTKTGVSTSLNNGANLSRDAQMAYDLALAYVISGDDRYAAASQHIIDAWAHTLTAVTTQQGRATFSFKMPFMIIAASWVLPANHWDAQPFREFLKRSIQYSTAFEANNHGFWGVLTTLTAAQFIGDTSLERIMYARWQTLMHDSVTEMGIMPAEMERSNTSNWRSGPDKGIKGLAYTHFTLLPSALTAEIFADDGLPVWSSPGGLLLGKAYAIAAQWTLHPETFPYYASNHGQLQGIRNAAYFYILRHHYSNQAAEALLAQGHLKMNGFHLNILYGS